jgi:Domain of unknown function (DUF1906)
MARISRLARAAGCLLLSFALSASADEPVQVPNGAPDCKPHPGLTIADFSFPVHALVDEHQNSVLSILKDQFKITAILRYYDDDPESIRGKTLTAAEADAILAAKLSIGTIFQHFNDDPTKFMLPNVGAHDADRALLLADRIGQPHESAIYFGIDGPERHLDDIKQEFRLSHGKLMTDARKAEILERERKRAIDEKKDEITKELRKQHKSDAEIAAYLKDYLSWENVKAAIERTAKSRLKRAVEKYERYLQYGQQALGAADLGSVTPEAMVPVIAQYFAKIRERFNEYRTRRGAGFKIGLYCTPMICVKADDLNWADYIWLSPEGRYDREYMMMLARSDRWNLLQYPESKRCTDWIDASERGRAISFDFNRPNPRKPNDFGLWNIRR